MDTCDTTARWTADTEGAWVPEATVRALLAACEMQRAADTADGGPAAALDCAAALLRGLLLSATPRHRPLETPGPVLALLVSLGGCAGEAAEDALQEAGW